VEVKEVKAGMKAGMMMKAIAYKCVCKALISKDIGLPVTQNAANTREFVQIMIANTLL
jgi:hypothetical protein